MPKINVYLPDDLAAAVREAGLSVSPICQEALAEAVRVVGAVREEVEVLRAPDFDPERQPQISARIAARMTDHLRHAVDRARDLARARGIVDTEHLLVGVIDEPDNLGTQVLRSLDVDVPRLREAAARAAIRAREGGSRRPRGPGGSQSPRGRDGTPAGQDVLGGLSPAARLAIAAALDGAVDLGHGFLGCEHLVLGLAEVAGGGVGGRVGGSVGGGAGGSVGGGVGGSVGGGAGELLRGLGIEPNDLRRAIPPAVAAAALGYSNARQRFAPAFADRLAEINRRLEGFEQRLTAGGL